MMEDWEERSDRIIRAIVAQRGWQLIQDEATFVTGICAEVQGSHIAAIAGEDGSRERLVLERTAIRHYCRILYAACCETGTARQQTAFGELERYLCRIAFYKTHDPDLVQDLVQQALIKIWNNLAKCRDVGSFLGYATLILLNEIRDYYRRSRRGENAGATGWDAAPTNSELEYFSFEEKEPRLESGHEGSQSITYAQVVADESEDELVGIIQACLKNAQQQMVLIGLYFEDKGYKEIAAELDITVNNVHVLRHRACAALRRSAPFMQFIAARVE